MTSHAAVMSRGMGRPCVSGAGSISIDSENRTFSVGGRIVKCGEGISIDGSTGDVLLGELPLLLPDLSGSLATVMGWADEVRTMGVWATCETAAAVRSAKRLGADGISLTRIENAFQGEHYADTVERLIHVDDLKDRAAILAEILPVQVSYISEILTIADGVPVNIRLLDTPVSELRRKMLARSEAYTDSHCRHDSGHVERTESDRDSLGIFDTFQLAEFNAGVHEMQYRAIFEAICSAYRKGISADVGIVIPFVVTEKEADLVVANVRRVYNDIISRHGVDFKYRIGVAIDTPRAAFLSNDLSDRAQFLVFGLEHLTGAVFGLPGRSEVTVKQAATHLTAYLEQGLIQRDPFASLDQQGVGLLMKLSCSKVRKGHPSMTIGVFGDQCSDPETIRLCHGMNVSYVSCPSNWVPSTRLAAAQAVLQL